MNVYDNTEMARAMQLEQEIGFRRSQLIGRSALPHGRRGNRKAFFAMLFGTLSTNTGAAPASKTMDRSHLRIPTEEV
jgi:hypothetical protein